MTAVRPFPESRTRHRRPFALACAVSLLFHGGLLAAAHWGWESATPIRIPPMIAVPVINAAKLNPPAGRPAPAPTPAIIEAKAPATTRTITPPAPVPKAEPKATAKPEAQEVAKANPELTRPKTARAKIPQASARPAWTRNPPAPPRRPINLAKPAPAQPSPPKQRTADPMQDAPPLFKPVPVTAPRAGYAKLRPASSAPARTAATAPPKPAIWPGLARASAAGLGNPPPPYPWISRQRGEQGRVILDVEVTSEGRARQVRVKRSSGAPRLDQAALKAVRDWRFAPARRAGKPVAGRIDVPITFRLTE